MTDVARIVALCIVAPCLVSSLAVTGAAAAEGTPTPTPSGGDSGGDAATPAAASTNATVDPASSVSVEIEVDESRLDAVTVTRRYERSDGSAWDAFERIDDNETARERARVAMTERLRTAAGGDDGTAVRNASLTVERENGTGVVRLSARVEGLSGNAHCDGVAMRDVATTGPYANDTRLVVVPPAGYGHVEYDPEPTVAEERRFVWTNTSNVSALRFYVHPSEGGPEPGCWEGDSDPEPDSRIVEFVALVGLLGLVAVVAVGSLLRLQ